MEYVLFALFLVYLLPWIVAEARGHERATALLLLNLAVGWTGVGWVALLLWARSTEAAAKPAPAEPALRLLPGGGEDAGRTRSAPALRVAERPASEPVALASGQAPAPAQSGSEKATSASPSRVPARACPPAATTT